ncbi:MAG: hypothetical protein AABM67_00195 [Acidobacteriota bacterium]
MSTRSLWSLSAAGLFLITIALLVGLRTTTANDALASGWLGAETQALERYPLIARKLWSATAEASAAAALWIRLANDPRNVTNQRNYSCRFVCFRGSAFTDWRPWRPVQNNTTHCAS